MIAFFSVGIERATVRVRVGALADAGCHDLLQEPDEVRIVIDLGHRGRDLADGGVGDTATLLVLGDEIAVDVRPQ